MTRRATFGTTLALSLLLFDFPASAAICQYKVNEAGVRPDGYVFGALQGLNNAQTGGWVFCNLNSATTVNVTSPSSTSIQPATCPAILSTLLTAKTTQRTLQLNFYMGSSDCSMVITAGGAYIIDPYPYWISLWG